MIKGFRFLNIGSWVFRVEAGTAFGFIGGIRSDPRVSKVLDSEGHIKLQIFMYYIIISKILLGFSVNTRY